MSNLIELKVPDIGGVVGAGVAEVYVKVGDSIKKDDNLIMLETDKATMEVPAEQDGIVTDVLIKVGGKVSEGDVMVKIEANTTDTPQTEVVDKSKAGVKSDISDTKSANEKPKGDESSTAKVIEDKPTTSSSTPNVSFNEDEFNKAFAAPSIRKLARELGADLTKVVGSGDKGRITEDDLKSFVKGIVTRGTDGGGMGLNLLPWPQVDFAKFGEIEIKALSRIKKISGANLARNWAMIPHVTQFDDADITELEDFRKSLNEEYKKQEIKITPLAFLLKASVFALKKFPEFNASLDGDNLIYKKYYNLGFAADTPNGLVVPVLKDANKKGILELAQESSELAKLAREGKLKPSDMQGGTFTISSLGGIGGTAFTPIINAPEVAILGVSKSGIKPVWDGSQFSPRLVLPLSLSYDHRIIDGALAAKFTTYLAQVLSDLRRLVL